VSEYNHPFPNRFGSEGMLFLAAYAGFHDIDGFMFFDYNGGTRWTDDRIESYFDMHRNTAQMLLMPSLARAFRDGLISPAKQTLLLQFTEKDVLLTPRFDPWAWQGVSPAPGLLALTHAVRIGSFRAPVSNRDAIPSAGQPPYVSDTGELRWDPAGTFTVSAPAFSAVTGFAGGGVSAGAMDLVSASDHLTATWVALDTLPLTRSRRSLLTIATRVQNTGMLWDGTNTIHNNWGGAPTLLAPVQSTLRLHMQADSLRLIPLTVLGGAGAAGRTILPASPGVFLVVLDLGAERSPWFGIEAMGEGPATSVGAPVEQPTVFGLGQNYPNPFNGTTQIPYTVGGGPGIPQWVRLSVYDVLGRRVAVLVDREMPAGKYVATMDAGALASGVYLLRLETAGAAAGATPVQRMLLMR
jgi:hypothetical protein